ncbi:hypothetical protein [Chitinophaga arvensicola]|nr:hypothetical protein [Chitinophaga arvensicola]
MIRTIIFAAILLSGMAAKAQTAPSFGSMNGMESAYKRPQQVGDTNTIHKKWFVTKYAGVSTGFVAFKGGGGSFLSVPLGLQLNRQLTPNLFAFGDVSVAPAVFRYNGGPFQPVMNKGNGFMQTNNNNFSANADARIGVMYINNDKTFSISGSIGVSRGTYGGYSPFYGPMSSPFMGMGNAW